MRKQLGNWLSYIVAFLKMSKHIHQYPISSTLKNKNDSHSNLTKGSAQSRRGAEVVRKVPRLIKISCGYCIYVLNLKPLKHNKSVSIPLWKWKILPRFPHFPRELQKGCYMQPKSLCAVLKNRYFRPWLECSVSYPELRWLKLKYTWQLTPCLPQIIDGRLPTGSTNFDHDSGWGQ